MKQLFEKTNSLRVLAWFFANPKKEIYLRELSRELGMAPSTVLASCRLLESEGMLERRAEKNSTFFKAKKTPDFHAMKIAYTVGKICDAKITGLFEDKSSGLSSILLFGSAARGEDGPDSDYDFMAVAAECWVEGGEIGRRLGREANVKKFTPSEWKKASKDNRAFYLEVISNCIALKGGKPVID